MRTLVLVLFGFLAMASPGSADWKKGVGAFNSKNYVAAVAEFEAVTKENPNYAGGFYMLGLAQNGLGQLSAAEASLRKAVELSGQEPSYRIALAQVLVKGEQYQEAYAALEALSLTGMETKYRTSYALLLGTVAAMSGQHGEEAARVLTAQAQADPRNAYLQQALGLLAASAKAAENKVTEAQHEQYLAKIAELEEKIAELDRLGATNEASALRGELDALKLREKKDYDRARGSYQETGQLPDGTPLPECPGFRNVKWGASLTEVTAVEGKPAVDKGASIAYLDKVAGRKVLVKYRFVERQLVSGQYLLAEEYAYKNQYIDAYREFKALLAKKYGNPVSDQVEWENELYKNAPGEWGMAVSIGHVTFRAKWVTDETDILLVLAGSNFKPFLVIEYSSRAHAELLHEAEDKARLEGL